MRDRDATRSRSIFELLVTAFVRNLKPAIRFKETDDFATTQRNSPSQQYIEFVRTEYTR